MLRKRVGLFFPASWGLILWGLLLGGGAVAAEPAETAKAGPFAMRGFGTVSLEAQRWENPARALSVFTCENEGKAQVVAAKYLADLLGYGATESVAVPGTRAAGVAVRHGGVFLVGSIGDRALVAWAASADDLARAVADRADWDAPRWRAPEAGAYPRYLDGFDNLAFGLWYVAGNKPVELLNWLRTVPGALNVHQHRLEMNPTPDVVDLAAARNVVAQAAWLDKPYRFMMWAGVPPWWGPRPENDVPERALGQSGGFSLYHASPFGNAQNASETMHAIMMNSMFRTMRAFVDRDDLIGWMEPHNEFHLVSPPARPPECETRYPAFLRDRLGYATPDDVAQAYGDAPYGDWSGIPYPEFSEFRGRRAPFVDLDTEKWKWRSASLEEGLTAGFDRPEFDDSAWTPEYRDSYRVLSHAGRSGFTQPAWFRFDADIPADFLAAVPADAPIYLHVMPMIDRDARMMSVWVNGTPVLEGESEATHRYGENSSALNHFEINIREHLKPGANRFAIACAGGRVAYRVFLSPHQAETYPHQDPALNRRWLDWRKYLVDEKLYVLEKWMRAMRAIDPVRPIKVMTPFMFQTDAMDIFARLGGYPQLTGEGAFYRPMHYKGYARLRGLPGSSEFGGPPRTRDHIQKFFATMFHESQDAHDFVFDPLQDIWPFKEVVAWIDRNHALINALGKTDFPPATVGLLRDTRQDVFYSNQDHWNWDLARGPLPLAGVSPVLVDGQELERDNANHVPLILDCGTWIAGDKQVAAIRRYVENGGTFVALHDTGRHGEYNRDSWPLAAAFGLKVEPRDQSEDSPYSWSRAQLAFEADQDLLPSLRGRTLDGSGVSINYLDQKHGAGIAIIPDGADVRPIARWADGALAVVEVRAGKGRFIWIGTPFMLRFRDIGGQWLNEDDRQALLEEMLAQLGFRRDTRVSQRNVWVEKRLSKNGIYDVCFGGYLNPPDGATPADTVALVPGLAAASARAAIEPTREGNPDVATTYADGFVHFGEQAFEPYQIRQWAVVRDHAGFVAPRHWLEKQKDTWRALEPVPAAAIIADVEEKLRPYLGRSFDLSSDWKALPNPNRYDVEPLAWTRPDFDDEYWQRVALGLWFGEGWIHETRVRYRKRVSFPPVWLESGDRIVIGISAGRLGVCERGTLWVDGVRSSISDAMGPWQHPTVDVTEAARAAGGTITLAMEIEGYRKDRGLQGTMYARLVPQPSERLALVDGWNVIDGWDRPNGEAVRLPFDGRRRVKGLRCRVAVPEAWAGKEIRLVMMDANGGTARTDIAAVMVNDDGFLPTTDFSVPGVRLDRWLKPGQENLIDFFGGDYHSPGYNGLMPNFAQAWLEVFE